MVPRHASAVSGFVIMMGALVQFSTGFDWTRWFAYWTTCAVIVWGLICSGREELSPPLRPNRTLLAVALLALLVVLPATNETNRLPCTWQAVAVDAPQPAERAWDALHRRPMTPLQPHRCTAEGDMK
jgi:hypothetical protein